MLDNLLSKYQTMAVLLVLVVLIAVYAVILYKKYKAQGKQAALADLRETVFALFLKMEEKYGPKTGPQKMAEAVALFYKYVMPDNLERLLPGTTVEKFLQDTFDDVYSKIKDLLDDGEMNKSVS